MRKISFLLVTIFLIGMCTAEVGDPPEFGYNNLDGPILVPQVNESNLPTVNNSEYFDGYSVSSLWTYYSGLGDSLWCQLTGCTMVGDIDMGGNNISNVENLYIDNYLEVGGSVNIQDDLDVLDHISCNGIEPNWIDVGGFYSDTWETNFSSDVYFEGDLNVTGNITADYIFGTTNTSLEDARLNGADLKGEINFDKIGGPAYTDWSMELIEEAGNVDAGEHWYYIEYFNADGDSTGIANSNYHQQSITTDATHGKVKINLPVSDDDRTVGRRIMRSKIGGNYYTTYVLTTINNNVDTEYIDNTADADLGDAYTYFTPDTTNNVITINNQQAMIIDPFLTTLGFDTGSAPRSILIGYEAGEHADGSNTLAIGASAGKYSDGSANTFVGMSSGGRLTSGSYNVLLGYNTMIMDGGNYGTFIGTQAGSYAVGSYNTYLGYQSGYGTTSSPYSSGTRNTAVGTYSGRSITSGYYNTLLGYRTGYDLTTGSSNVLIGYEAGENIDPTDSNKLYIENSDSTTPLIYGEFDNDVVRINGALAIGNNTFGNLSSGDINASTIFLDNLVYKSPVFQCSDDWCSVSFPKHQKTLWIQKDNEFNILDIVYEGTHYTKLEFWNLVKDTQYSEIALKLNEKINKLSQKQKCNNVKGILEGKSCVRYETIKESVSYNEAVKEITINITEVGDPYTCYKLNEKLEQIESTCYDSIVVGSETMYEFRERCDWDEEEGYYCLIKNREVII